MIKFAQLAGALLGVTVAGLWDPTAPWLWFALVAFVSGYAAAWLAARWKYGKGIIVRFSRKVD